MRLEDCTKSELIEIIAQLQMRGVTKFDVDMILNHLESRRRERKYEEAENLLKAASEAYATYVELLSPYDSKKFREIPNEVLFKAETALKEYKTLTKKWMKVMGIQ